MNEQTVPETLPFFPLPNIVFFPGTLLPLHVFEERYIQLINDIHGGDGWLAVPLLRPGFQRDYLGAPAIHATAGAGRVIRMREQPDHTLSVEIQGLVRVSLEEMESDRLYRRARAIALAEPGDWLEHPEADEVLQQLIQEAAGVSLISPKEVAGGVPTTREGRTALINGLAGRVLVDTPERQHLLEAPGFRVRTELLRHHIKVMGATAEALARFPRPEHPENN